MRAEEFIPESSPDTPAGSVTRDLMLSKLWLCRVLQELGLTEFDSIYILGSWFGALALILKRLPFTFDQITCVDRSPGKFRYLDRLLKQHGIRNIRAKLQRAESIDYPAGRLLVINTSTNDITGTRWLDRIPADTVVAIQGRDNQDNSNGIETLDAFDSAYPLSDTLFLDAITVTGVDDDRYQRFMKIGIV